MTVTGICTVEPASKLVEFVEGVKEKSTPVPLSATEYDELSILSRILSEPAAGPYVWGKKETETVQLEFGGSDDGQLLLCMRKRPVPPMLMAPMNDRGKFPVLLLVRVTVEGVLALPTGWAENVSDVADKTMLGFTVSWIWAERVAPLPDTPVMVTGKVPTATWLWPLLSIPLVSFFWWLPRSRGGRPSAKPALAGVALMLAAAALLPVAAAPRPPNKIR